MKQPGSSFSNRTRILKESWRVLFVGISFLIAIGVVQVNVFSIQIPAAWRIPIVLGVVIVSSLASAVWSFVKLLSVERKLSIATQTIAELQNNAPLLFIEGVPVQGLTAHVFQRRGKSPNPVHLDLLQLTIAVQGSGARRDAAVKWRFVGVNTAATILTGLRISIAGETLISFSQLKSVLYDLGRDPNRTKAIMPKLIGEDSTNKELLLPFISPGINAYQRFELEFHYVWPAVVNTQKDYWFVDPMNHAQSVDRLIITVESVDSFMTSAYAFQLDSIGRGIEFQGSLPIQEISGTQTVTWEVDKPAPKFFHMLIIQGTAVV